MKPDNLRWPGWREDDEDDLLWDDDEEPTPPLPLSRVQQAALATVIEHELAERGCDNTLRAVQTWAAGAGLDWRALEPALQGNGGFCDCEVLLNVGLATT